VQDKGCGKHQESFDEGRLATLGRWFNFCADWSRSEPGFPFLAHEGYTTFRFRLRDYGNLNPKMFLKCTIDADENKADNTAAPHTTRRSVGIQSRNEKTSIGKTGIRNLEKSQTTSKLLYKKKNRK
jgi:hypothetical protein